jgi:hypothetical protein
MQVKKKLLPMIATATSFLSYADATPAPQDPPSQENRAIAAAQLQPTPFTNDELKTIRSWANSKNGILRSIASYNDPFTQAFNRKNPAAQPLTFEGVNSAFVEQFQIPLERLIKIDSDLKGVDQSYPHYAYLSSPVQWNSKSLKQPFRILHRDQKSIDKDRQAIEDNNFSGQNGNPLSSDDKRLALRALKLTRPHWDLRSPYRSAKLETTKDGFLRSLEFDVAKVGAPELKQPRTIYFQHREDQETPSEIPQGTIFLKPNQYQDIRKANP